MPVFVGKFLKSIIRTKHRSNSGGLKLRTDTIWGFFLLVFLRNLRPLRRQMHRFNLEEDRINLWSKAVFSAMSVSGELALELARCGAFVKGYGDTYERGNACLQAILDDVEIQMTARQSLDILIERVRKAREAASIDPSGSSLARYLGNTSLQLTYQPIKFYRGRS